MGRIGGWIIGLVVATVAVSATPAEAYRLGGVKWPKHTITYRSLLKNDKAVVRDAVRAWNTSGARIRFKAVRRNPDIVLRYKRGLPGMIAGNAPLGYQRYRFVNIRPKGERYKVGKLPPNTVLIDDGRSPGPTAQVLAHELGHVIGLAHETRRCAVMQPANDGCPQPERPLQERCRVLEPDDVRGAIARYGGRLRKPAPAYCFFVRAPRAPRELTVTPVVNAEFGKPRRELDLRFVGEDVKVGRIAGTSYRATATAGTCAADDAGATLLNVAESPERKVVRLAPETTIGPGRWCVRLSVVDAAERRATVTAFVDVPPLPDAVAPELSLSFPGFAAVGQEVRITAFARDDVSPGVRVTVDFGDPASGPANVGSCVATETAGSSSCDVAHVYGAPGDYPIVARATDDAGNVTERTDTVTVAEAPPPEAPTDVGFDRSSLRNTSDHEHHGREGALHGELRPRA